MKSASEVMREERDRRKREEPTRKRGSGGRVVFVAVDDRAKSKNEGR